MQQSSLRAPTTPNRMPSTSSERPSGSGITGATGGVPRTPSSSRDVGSANLPSWAPQRHIALNKAPTEDNSDSDDDGSQMGEDEKIFSPISRNLLATICIFGADGNLSTKKILPTIFQLWKRKLVPRDLLIFGYARAQMNTEQFRKIVFRCIYNPVQPQGERKEFLQRCHFVSGQFNDEAHMAVLVQEMEDQEAKRLSERATGGGGGGDSVFAPSGGGLQHRTQAAAAGSIVSPSPRRSSESLDLTGAQPKEQVRMYYFAVPPFLYAGICGGLRSIKKQRDQLACSAASAPAIRTVERFVLEKPFGRDTESCAQLVRGIATHLTEEEIYRIDHYLGKELVMNLLVLRFANVAFSSIWNRQTIKSVQVIFKEDFGTEGRGGYFDQYGIIRDVMQNHLLQVMALVAMEQPLSFTAEHIMSEKLKVLQACEPLKQDDLVTGQYVRCGKQPGYLEDPTIENKDSTTETFATAVLHVNTPRWDGVPFVLKAGKALTDRKAEVRIQFHRVPGVVSALKDCAANELVVRLQPEQTIYWKVVNKVPGLKFQVQQMRMDLLYSDKFNNESKPMPEAYERLLLEVLAADHSHFVSAAELDASWRIFTPILKQIAEQKIRPHPYPYGSRGPTAADSLAHKYGMSKFGGGITNYVTGAPIKKLNQTDEQSLRAASGSSDTLSVAAASSLLAAKGAANAASAKPSFDSKGAANGPSNSSAESVRSKSSGLSEPVPTIRPPATGSLGASAATARGEGGAARVGSGGIGGDKHDGSNATSNFSPPLPHSSSASKQFVPASVALPAGIPRTNTLSPTSSVEDDSPERRTIRREANTRAEKVEKEHASTR